MAKQRRTVLSGIVTPFAASPPPVEGAPAPAPTSGKRAAATIQQTVYLAPPVHEQLSELAFPERVKMHALLMEGLDLVFKARGLRPLSELTRTP
jgi:hypothetical protein